MGQEILAADSPPEADRCVLPRLLAAGAAAHPDKVFAVFDDGTEWTYAAAFREARAAASALRRAGVAQGDPVLVWLPNGPDILRAWFGLNQLGAVYVPMNTAYRGGVLEHVIRDSTARVAIVHPDLEPRLREVSPGSIEGVLGPGDLHGDPADPAVQETPAQPWDPYAIIYTSGTTGPSKGVVSPYLQVWAAGAATFEGRLTPADRYLINLPLFHVGGTICVVGALAQGASIAVESAFDTRSFWDVIRRTESTWCGLLGVMASFLLKQPPSDDDRNHPLRRAIVIPLAEDAKAFGRRFGCDVITGFNMTEISGPLGTDWNPEVLGSCGTPRPGVDVQVVDEHDLPVRPGQTGELIVRTRMPWTMATGYWRNPEATAAAWRNGWFHTGDAFRVGPDGSYFFVDRLKDALRRRGENISSFEVEGEILSHPAVREAAVVGVPSPDGEDDVLAVVAPAPDTHIDPVELIEHLVPRLPHFMVPRYIRVLAELPKTATNKVEKHLLRDAGVTADTWDREKAGIIVRRERVGGRAGG